MFLIALKVHITIVLKIVCIHIFVLRRKNESLSYCAFYKMCILQWVHKKVLKKYFSKKLVHIILVDVQSIECYMKGMH